MTEGTVLKQRNNGEDLPVDFPERLESFREVAGLSWGNWRRAWGWTTSGWIAGAGASCPGTRLSPISCGWRDGCLAGWTPCFPTW